MKLTGRVALISGAARGLGLAISRRFAAEGASVMIADIRQELAEHAAAALRSEGYAAASTVLDVRNEDSWRDAFLATDQAFGPANILVNNAGVAILASIEDTTFDDWRSVMSVNLDGVFLGTKTGVARMRDHGGSIVNISSIRAFAADPNSIAYDASKGGVLSLTRSAAVHCAKQGYPVKINSLHPGYVMTDMIDEATAGLADPDGLVEQIRAAHPIGRTGTAEEIADAALFLASDDARFMVGSALVIDGGYTAI